MSDEGLNTGMLGELDRKNARIAQLEADLERAVQEVEFKDRELEMCKERHRLEVENIQLRLEKEFASIPQSQTPYLDKIVDVFTKAADFEREAEKRERGR